MISLFQRLKKSIQKHHAIAYMIASIPLIAIIQIASYWLRFEGNIDDFTASHIQRTLIWVILIKVAIFSRFGIYQGWNRFLTFHDLITLSQATIASSLVLVLTAFLFIPDVVIPRSVFLLDSFGTVAVFGCLRSTARFMEEYRPSLRSDNSGIRAFIIGANDSGEALLRAIRRNHNIRYDIVGFLAGQSHALPSRISGIPVLGNVDQLDRLAARHAVREILITAGEFSGKDVRKIVEKGRSVGVEVKVLPSFEQLLHGHVDLRPRTVSIQDLLRRDPVQLDIRGLHQWLDNKVLWVTGAAGSIGSEICRQLLQFEPRKLILIDRSENGLFFLEHELRKLAPDIDLQFCIADAGDQARMEQLCLRERPDIIFHAAAYKHVPLMEANPCEAIKNIVLATRNLADLADRFKVGSFVMISTDKAVNPTSVMGACKRVAEIYVQSLATSSQCNFVTVRFGNVLDSAGSVVPIFREQIAQGGPVTVTHPQMKRYFMTIPEASQLVIQAGAMGQGGEIFVLDMGEPVRIVDLAHEMINLSGLEIDRDIEIQFSGIRPGEKLFEELHISGENHLPTVHPKIMIAESTPTQYAEISNSILQMSQTAHRGNTGVVAQLSEAVPQYRQNETSAPKLARAA
ncbi:MAG: nucleoside-diphosphate sugar epimerase/dehydratase [Pirellulaceae bacterium]|nr:nucleoside-diphosphate sugar epimerase/dehydratase [Pirellulaceae bacterium]